MARNIKVIEKQLKLKIAVSKSAGKVKPISAKEMDFSPFGIGLEKADGGFYDPSAAYGAIGELGAKWVRIQSGWARCEKQRGSYDFEWLDDMVENILAQGAQPWICLCYGNPLYDVRAPKGSRAVGFAPIFSHEAANAWTEYVKRIVSHYIGKVGYFEIWNEPDGTHCWKSGVNGKEYGNFVLTTAKAIKSANAHAKIIAGSMCNLIRLSKFCADTGILFDKNEAVANFFEDWLSTGAAQLIDYVTVHIYQGEPEVKSNEFFRYVRKTLNKYNRKIGIIQGETGTHAAFSNTGALNSFEWTERKQAKYLLRRMYTDMVHGVFFSSYFSCLDMYENLNNERVCLSREQFGFYGVLAAEFDERDVFKGTYRKRLSFYAFQALCAAFSDGAKKCRKDFEFIALQNSYWGSSDVHRGDPLEKQLLGHSFQTKNGKKFEAFYMASSVLNIDYSGTTSLRIHRELKSPAMIDLLDGKVYPIREENILRDREVTELYCLPLKDYPCLLVDLSDTQIQQVLEE